jgi:hypothetical protein
VVAKEKRKQKKKGSKRTEEKPTGVTTLWAVAKEKRKQKERKVREKRKQKETSKIKITDIDNQELT